MENDVISRQKAINTVHRMREIWDTGDIDDLEEMIVTALAELCPDKRTETHTCDCIERQAAIDALKEAFNPSITNFVKAKIAIDKLPSAQQEQKGYWRHYEGYLTCSECGTEYYADIMEYCGDDVPKFCPNCGANMEGCNE